jgi:WD40 repeat protein
MHRFDRCICIYDTDKLDKPKEAFKRVKDPGKAGITSLAFDPHNNVLLAGSLDGVLRVWSVEGRWAQPVCHVMEFPAHKQMLTMGGIPALFMPPSSRVPGHGRCRVLSGLSACRLC